MTDLTKTVSVLAQGNDALTFHFDYEGALVLSEWDNEISGCPASQRERDAQAKSKAALYFTNGVLDFAKCYAIRDTRTKAYRDQSEAEKQVEAQREKELGPRPEKNLHMSVRKTALYDAHGPKKGTEHYQLIPTPNETLIPREIIEIYEAWENGIGVAGPLSGIHKKSDGKPCSIPSIAEQYPYWKAFDEFDKQHNIQALDEAGDSLHSEWWEGNKLAAFAPAKTLRDIATKSEHIAEFCDTKEGESGLERFVLDGLARDIRNLLNTPQQTRKAA